MKTKEMNNKKKVLSVALLLLLVVGAVMTSAYFTDHNKVTNEFTFGSGVDTELTEPKWDSEGKEKAKSISPNMKIVKDPTITNKGDDSFNFISVKIPHDKFAAMGSFKSSLISEEPAITATGECTDFAVNATGTINTEAKNLFSFTYNANNWKPIEVKVEGNYQEYIFAYIGEDRNMKALKKGESTAPLFSDEEIRVINLVNDEWATANGCQTVVGKTFNIPVEVYSIQTKDLIGNDDASETNPFKVWEVVKAQIAAMK